MGEHTTIELNMPQRSGPPYIAGVCKRLQKSIDVLVSIVAPPAQYIVYAESFSAEAWATCGRGPQEGLRGILGRPTVSWDSHEGFPVSDNMWRTCMALQDHVLV